MTRIWLFRRLIQATYDVTDDHPEGEDDMVSRMLAHQCHVITMNDKGIDM